MSLKRNGCWEITLLTLIAMGHVVYFSQAILFPVALAAVLFFLFGPCVRKLQQKGLPRSVSSAFIILCFVLTSGFVVSRLVGPASEWIEKAPKNLPLLEKKLSFIKKPIEKISNATEKVENIASVGGTSEKKVEVANQSSSLGYAMLDITSNAFSMIMTTLVLLYFFLVYGSDFLNRCGTYIKSKSGPHTDLVEKIERGISSYLVIFCVVNICLALIVGIALWFVGVPNAFLWGAMAGVLNFIPYLGPIVGCGVVFFVSLLSFDSAWQAALPVGLYAIINALEGQFVTPVLIGKRLSLNPLVILISMLFWGWAWGLEGALLSVPLLAIFKIICDEAAALQHIGKIIES